MGIQGTSRGTWSLQDPQQGPWEGLQELLGGVPAMGVATPPPESLLEAPERWPEIDPGMGMGIPSLSATLAERLAWLDLQWKAGKVKLTKRTRQRLRRSLARELSNDKRLRRFRVTRTPRWWLLLTGESRGSCITRRGSIIWPLTGYGRE